MEAGNTGRGVLFPIAHSLNKSSELSQFERWREALMRSENRPAGLDPHAHVLSETARA
jgi:hypothetical protein